ncbi:3' terminal RNA ribose 2'-O-methyltransferase Hen1 [soil metagenome]
MLTISTTHSPATDLGFLLHKHPDKVQVFSLNFGKAIVAYPEVSDAKCTMCLLLDVDPVGLVRGRDDAFALGQYVNDRPYVASSFLSVAISRVFGTALGGTLKSRPELAELAIPLEARLEVLPVRGGETFLRSLFEPLGYEVTATRLTLDTQFPEWGDSPYYTVTLRATCRVADLLSHLYVLVPVFDGRKHYYIGDAEVEKLLAKGEGWLATHPAKEEIAKRYLARRASLVKEALARLTVDEEPGLEEKPREDAEEKLERPISLNTQRHEAVVNALVKCGAARVLDLGCGEGKLLKSLLHHKQFKELVGVDVSIRTLEVTTRRLHLDQDTHATKRVKLLQGSLVYRDSRLAGFDAAAVVEVIEHLDPPRLAAFERVLFEFARPKCVILTTPNAEYNALWETLPAGKFRHPDHRFEWTRAEFESWAKAVAERFGYKVTLEPVGPVDDTKGPPTQMAVFEFTGSGR